ncbi:MAG: hypothetical protein KY394_00340 [Actinobacteria bacterium]|nr:hypothetical protein [Actinomycetota bacterium]
MQKVAIRAGSLWLAAMMLTAASYGGAALFRAPHPGGDLQPVDGAERVIQLLQGGQSVLWTTLEGTVSLYTVIGWPSSHDDAELGGALMMRTPSDGGAGVIDFGEKPMTLQFELGG